MELKEKFDQAVIANKELPSRPNNDTLLIIYSLFKQATEGDINAPKPVMFDFVGQAKYNAWEKLKGMSADDAMLQYVEVVESLK